MAHFTRVKHIATAGQGELWTAHRGRANELVVVKYLRRSNSDDENRVARERFEREVRKQSKLLHHGIMPILDHNFDDDPPWYAMPLACSSLLDRLTPGRPLDDDELKGVMNAVFDAIECAHGQGIVHRDLKPANILLLPGRTAPRWVVADFGLCRDVRSDSVVITATSTGLGSIQYMAPEQFSDAHRVGFTADVFALGRILQHCATGTLPPYWSLDPGNTPPRFREIVRKATAEARRDRYPSLKELRRAFDSAFDHRRRPKGRSIFQTSPLKVSDLKVQRDRRKAVQRRMRQRTASWLPQWESISGDLHDLTQPQFIELILHMLLAVDLAPLQVQPESGRAIDLLVEAETGERVGVRARRHRYHTPSSEIRGIEYELHRGWIEAGLLFTTGTLSLEARDLVEGNARVTATEGPVLIEVLRSTLDVTAGLCPWTGREHEPRAAMSTPSGSAQDPNTDPGGSSRPSRMWE